MGKYILFFYLLNCFSVKGQYWDYNAEVSKAKENRLAEKKTAFFKPEFDQDTIENEKMVFDYKKVIERSIDGIDYLFGNLNNELILSSIFDENGRIDSNQLVKSMHNAIDIMDLYNIPTTSDIFKLVYGNYYSVQKDIKQKCLRTYTCSDPKKFSVTSYESFQLINMATTTEGANFLFFKHPHECKNCSDWSEAYKKKVACNTCKDSRTTYCGKSFTCLVCNGKGYRMLKTEPEKISAKTYLSNEGIKITNYMFYFNSIDDFGIYIVDKNKTINYKDINSENALIRNDKVSIVLTKSGDYFIDKLEEHNRLKLEDSINISRIYYLIEANNADSAAYLFSGIHYPSNALKAYILDALVLQHKNDFVIPTTESVNAFINDNKTKLLTLEPTTLKITLNQDGTFEGITSDYITKSIIPEYKTINGFKVPISIFFELKITKKESYIENSEKLFINTYEEVRQKNNGKFYVATSILNVGYLNPSVEYYNPDEQTRLINECPELKGKINLKEGYYMVLKSKNVDRYINGQKYGSYKKEEIVGEYKMVKRIPKIIGRSSFILGGLGWLGFRVYEMSKVSKN
jgi:hypothetical protein